MRLLFLFLFIFAPVKRTEAQSNDSEAAFYNVSFGGLNGAIGALINKKEGEKSGKIILKGLWQGALGGYVTFESKRVLRFAGEKEDWKLFWTSNLINSAGNSIKENAANNVNFWDQWNLTIGFNRIEFHTKENFYIRYKIMPITASYTLDALFRYKFDLSNSLKSGHFIFERSNLNSNYLGVTLFGYYSDG